MKYNESQGIYIIDWVYRNEYRIKGKVKKVRIRGIAKHISSSKPWYFINVVDKETGYYETVYEDWIYKTKEEAEKEIIKTLKKTLALIKKDYNEMVTEINKQL